MEKISHAKNKSQEEVFKVYRLQQDSVKWLYQKRLEKHLVNMPTSNDLETEWNNIRECIRKAAYESVGMTNKIRRRKGLRMWNKEIEEPVKEKQKAYINLLQKNTEEAKENYKEKRNYAKQITRRAQQEDWDQFITNAEHDVYGRQIVACKMMRHLNRLEKDVACINVINTEQWKNHYKKCWYREETMTSMQ